MAFRSRPLRQIQPLSTYLLPDRNLHGRGLIEAFDHHRRAQLEHPRSSCAGSDHINYKLQIEPCLLSQDPSPQLPPRSTRLRAMAPPMMPSPTIPTVLFI